MAKSIIICIVWMSICSGTIVIYNPNISDSYPAAYSDKGLIPPMNRTYLLVDNITDCNSDRVLLHDIPYSPASIDVLSSACAGVIFPDRDIYYGISSPALFTELSVIFKHRFIVLTPFENVFKMAAILSGCNCSSNIDSCPDDCQNVRVQFGYTTYSPWYHNSVMKYTIRIVIASLFFVIGYLARIYDQAIKDAGKYTCAKFTPSSILHVISGILAVLSVCMIVDPLFSDGIFSPRVSVILAAIPLCLPACCLMMMALYWKDSLDEIFEFNYVSRYGSVFGSTFVILSAFMLIIILAGAFIGDMSYLYPYIKILHAVMSIINFLALVIYDIYIVIIFRKMLDKNRFKTSRAFVRSLLIQITMNIGVITRIIGSLIFIFGLTEMTADSGLYSAIYYLLLRVGECISFYAWASLLGEFKINKDKDSESKAKSKTKSKTKSEHSV